MISPRLRFSMWFVLGFGLIFAACNKDPQQKGCTDYTAINYDPSALVEDGSCQYENRTERIFFNGQYWGWQSDLINGGYVTEVCKGRVEIVPPTKTAIDSSGHMVVYADSSGNALMHIRIVNPRDGRAFRYGNIRFDARLPQENPIPDYETFMNGKVMDYSGECGGFRRSDFQGFTPTGLSDTAYAEVKLPILGFPDLQLQNIDNVFGLEVHNAIPNAPVLYINNLRWTTR